MSEQTKEKKISLNINERLNLSEFIPQKGNYIEITLIKDIKEKIVFSQEEIKEYELKGTDLGGGRINWKWNKTKDLGKEIMFTNLELKMIQDGIKKADKEKTLNEGQMSLYEKFMKDLA